MTEVIRIRCFSVPPDQVTRVTQILFKLSLPCILSEWQPITPSGKISQQGRDQYCAELSIASDVKQVFLRAAITLTTSVHSGIV